MKTSKKMMHCFLWVLALSLIPSAFNGCGGGGGGGTSDAPKQSNNSEITVSSNQINFGSLVANQTADNSFTIQNTGTRNLVIGQISTSGAPFEIVAGSDHCSNRTLLPNQSGTIIVRFTPTANAVYTGSFVIPSNDPDESSLTVNLSGVGQGLNVTINRVDSSVPGNIRMIVSVTDANGDAVANLPNTAFTVFEEGEHKPTIVVSNADVHPVSAVLALDNSGSFWASRLEVQNSAKTFLDQLRNSDEVAVIKFAQVIQLAADFTQLTSAAEINNLKAAIDAPYTDSINATLLFDAVYNSVDRLILRNPNNRLAIIVVTDGQDYDASTLLPGSTHTLDEVIAHAQQAGVFIFTIGLGADMHTAVARRMANETGGEYLYPPTPAGLNAIYTKISQILINQYEITFNTTKLVGTLNNLHVIVDDGTMQGDDAISVTY